MGEGGGELITTNESTVVTKPLLDAIVVEDRQSDGCLADPTWTNECDWGEVFSETNNLLDQVVTSTAGPWRWGWGFTGYTRSKCEILNSLVVEIPDLVLV